MAHLSSHPYFPPDTILSGGIYTANTSSAAMLVLTFGAVVSALLLATFVISRRVNANLGVSDQALVLWFVMSE